jgi:DNA-binding beta-propeller fold protein YncE
MSARIQTIARSPNPFTLALSKDGRLFVADATTNAVLRVDMATGRTSPVTAPTGATDEDVVALGIWDDRGVETLFVVERLGRRIRRTTLDGAQQGPAIEGFLAEPHDVAGGAGFLVIADVGASQVIGVRLTDGVPHWRLGQGKRLHSGDGGPAARCELAGARAVAYTPDAALCIVEREGNTIRRVDRAGIITTIAGTGAKGSSGDGGPARDATFDGPKGIASDAVGNLYVVDTENHAIRRIDAKSGRITTVAGGREGDFGDGGPAHRAGLNRPHGVVVAPDGFLLIADSGNGRIRRVGPLPKP